MSHDLRTLIDEYIESNSRLSTPVALFADAHETGNDALVATACAQLIPLSTPEPGEQYAFEVNLDACSGCKACVAACHSLNGLDEGESWRDVGLIFGEELRAPYQQTITSACHHCADPGCLNGCPVLAYEKDPITGIVRHLDDQCIGCQYCVLKCPYDVPKYNPRLGIVRKCDLCHQRLAVGEAPACVQSCPTHAIKIVKVELKTSPTKRPALDTSAFLAAAPSAERTLPTTRYVSSRPIPENTRAADQSLLRVQPLHAPLVLMLALTQAGYGLLAYLTLLGGDPSPRSPWMIASLLLIASGLVASTTHLGHPLRAWRIFLNLRRSWLSREALVLGLSLKLLLGYLAAALFLPNWPTLAHVLLLAGLCTGLIGVFCSAMLYIDTGRKLWTAPRTFTRMGGTVLVFASACYDPVLGALLLTAKLLLEASLLPTRKYQPGPDSNSARLQCGPLLKVTLLRFLVGLTALVALFIAPLPLALPLLLIGELLERALFFLSVDRSAMPGMPASAHNISH